MSGKDACKILICGDVGGRLKSLYNRINKVLSVAGDFEALFCVGDFFGETGTELEYFIENPDKVAIPTYLLSPTNSVAMRYITDLNGCEICPNIKFLGQQGTYTTISGLKVVYVCLNEDNESDSGTWMTEFPTLESDPSFNGVDLLLTSKWPKYIVSDTESIQPIVVPHSSIAISHIAQVVKPRYHFAATAGIFYERKPYRNHQVLQEKEKLVTRFIGLAKVANKENMKFLYALNVTPVEKMSQSELVVQPPDITENPYRDQLKKAKTPAPKETEVQTDQFFYSLPTGKRGVEEGPENRRRKANWKLKKYDNRNDQIIGNVEHKLNPERERGGGSQDACWFCLGNPQVAKHLLVTIATQAYLAMPRGPLVKDHLLILTVGHHQSWLTCPDYVRKDIEAYKTSLRAMFKAEGKAIVTFERNFKTHHYQLQVVPVPFSVAAEVKKAFLELSETVETSPCRLEPLPKSGSLTDFCKPGIPYFYVELPTGEKLFNRIEKERVSTSDINFGRAVLASPPILNCTDRINWRECTEDEATETELTLELRKKFSAFDFS